MKRWLESILFLGLLLFLIGCNSALDQATITPMKMEEGQQETATAFQPATNTPKLQHTITVQPTKTATLKPTEVGCQEKNGTVLDSQVAAVGYTEPLEYKIYLPPCYKENPPDGGYPLLTLIHGQTYTPQQWIDIGLVEKMDQLITSGEIEPFVVVMPYESSAYSGGLHTAIVVDLISHLQEEYLVCQGSSCNAIGGISRGGGWALTAAFKNTDFFISLGLHSVPSSAGHLDIVRYGAASAGVENLPRIWVDFGMADYWYASEKDLVDTFDYAEVAYDFTLNEGGHDNEYWESHLIEYLRWYAVGWETNDE
jgi:enterochelin esterase-like enzyme